MAANTKILAGFLAGAVAASVASYLVSSHQTRLAPAPAPAPVPAAAFAPLPIETPEPKPEPAPVATPVKKRVVVAAAPIVVAKEEPPLPEPVKEPEPQPVMVETPPPPPPVREPEPQRPMILKPERETRPEAVPNTVVLQPGTMINVRLAEALSSKKNETGDTFFATLDEPLVVDGYAIAERGARAEGRITEVDKTKGPGRLKIELTALSTSDGQKIAIRTSAFEKTGTAGKGEDALKVGAGAVIGTAIGAAAGGGKGAAIGAAAGTAAGIGTALATRSKPAELPSEARIGFRVEERVVLTERR
jgi:outer membrane biosynthesis protein TonB